MTSKIPQQQSMVTQATRFVCENFRKTQLLDLNKTYSISFLPLYILIFLYSEANASKIPQHQSMRFV